MYDDSLPLFLLHEDSIIVYVVDNQLLGCYPWSSYGYYGAARSLNLMLELFSSPLTHQAFPEQLHHHFQNTAPLPVHEVFDFVIGAKGYYGRPNLDFRLTIDPSLPKSVSFHSFTLEDLSFPFQISLTPEEAFLIFANHCVNSRIDDVLFDPDTRTISRLRVFDMEEAKEKLEAELSEIETNAILQHTDQAKAKKQRIENAHFTYNHRNALERMNQFVFEYFDLMKESFLSEKILLPLLLRLNGVGLLTFFRSLPTVQQYFEEIFAQLLTSYSKLSFNQKIMYFSLILKQGNSWYIDNPSQTVQDFFVEKEDIINKLKKEIEKDFPHKS